MTRAHSAVIAAAAALSCCTTGGDGSFDGGGATYAAEVRRTAYGVPHVIANDYGGIGYGIGYAAAEDNVCEIYDRMMTVLAERARHLGPGENDANLISDLYHQRIIDSGELERLLDGPEGDPDTPSADARLFMAGFAAGVSRYVRDIGVDNINDPRCQGAPWVREIDEIDYWRTVLAPANPIQGAGTVAAAPPGAEFASNRWDVAVADDPLPDGASIGSNAYGLGREVTKSGRGVLLGNPHYPWDGPNRFYRMHFIIPGELNIVGAGLVTAPRIGIGHNEHIAWTHTVSTARRFGYFELRLDPSDPTRYFYEGEWEAMQPRDVTVMVRTQSGLEPETRTLYDTRYGPMIETETLAWTEQRGFALRVMPQGLRSMDQYLAIWKAESVRDLREVLGRHQATGFNTTATDSGGEALFGDMGMIPNVDDELVAACSISPMAQSLWADSRIPVLDGSRAACDWRNDPDATAPGVFAPDDVPYQFRDDYVIQSNDSHWLANPEAPLVGYSPVVGDEATARSLRTRLALQMIADRVSGEDGYDGRGFDLQTLQQVMFNNRDLGGELTRDDLVAACRGSGRPHLARACDVLAAWDLKVDLDSRGAHLFRMFAEEGGLRFVDRFDSADPVHTPRVLDVNDPEILRALEAAVSRLEALDIPLNAALGDVQAETRGAERIPIHGGPGPEGVFNVITSNALEPERGWTSIRHGSSWVMTVEFTDDGPLSQGVLTYSQSTNPNSPHYSDQTWLYSQKGWDDLLFDRADVEAATVSRIVLRE